MRLIVLSTPGADTRTQVVRLAEALGVPRLDSGSLLRAAVAAGTPLGLRAQVMFAAGAPVPDELSLAVLTARLAGPDTRAGFLLDGYPRDLPQARALDALLADLDRPIDAVVQFASDEQALREHLAADALGALRARLDDMRARHAALADYYRAAGKLTGLAQLPMNR